MKKSLNLLVEIDEQSGFCFGVISAIKKAEKHLATCDNLYCLGEIVHNGEEITRLEKLGLITIDHKELQKLKNKQILFRAHGEPPSSYALAKENKNKVIDASCPIILKLQQRIKHSYQNGETILIYGKYNHPEVIALRAYTENCAIVFEKIEQLREKKLPKEFSLYSQTTKSLDKFYSIINELKKMGYKVNVNDTICRQVSNRHQNLSAFCKKYDKIVFVAGKNSSNGQVLYNICKQENQHTFFISHISQIKTEWFSESESVGICGATSTPKWLMDNAKKYLASL